MFMKKFFSGVTAFAVIFLSLGAGIFIPEIALAVAPTVTSSFPANGAANVPIGSSAHVTFSTTMDSSTLTPSNITFVKTSNSSAVPFSLRIFPDGFDVVPSVAPTFADSARYAKLFNTSVGLFNIISGQQMVRPSTGYVSPTIGDILYFQHDTFPAEVGIVTNPNEIGGTFAVNNFPLFGSQQLIKFGLVKQTGSTSTTSVSPTLGDVIVANTSLNPTSDRYDWHIVTSADIPANNAAFRLDNSTVAPTFVSGSIVTTITPTSTSAVNGSSQFTMNLSQGDMLFGKVTANADNLSAYKWHLVTTAENISGAIPNTLRLDGNTGIPTLAVSTQISKKTPAAQGPVSDTSPTLNIGDVMFTSITAGGANLNGYNFHVVSGSGVPNSPNLRLDNSPASLQTGTSYTLTVGTGVRNTLSEALGSAVAIAFSTSSTGATNITPPFVTSSAPQPGSQTFPIGAPITLVFSQDMSVVGGTTGAGSVTNPSNVGLFLDNFGTPGATVAAARSYNSATKTLTITPSSPLITNTGYLVKVFSSCQSATGATANPFFIAFRTASGADTVKPKVLGVFPSLGASSVALPVSDISIGFSEDISSTTITGSTITITPTTTNVVSYHAGSRSAHLSLSDGLLTSTLYVVTVGTGVTDLSANVLEGNGGVANAANTSTNSASSYVFNFTTSATADTTAPTVVSANADNFSVVVTFSEGMKTGAGPSAVDNIANYTLENPVGTSASLAGKTVTYNSANQTATITGLSLQPSSSFKMTVSSTVKDLAGNLISTSGSPAGNTAQGTVLNSSTTGGQLGPGSGSTQNPGAFGMTPIRVMPMNRAAGATSTYEVNFPTATSIPSGGSFVVTFPVGFDVSTVAAAANNTESFHNSDINGAFSGTVTIASVTPNATARTVTVVTGGAATGTNAFVMVDLKGIVNTTVPSSSGYTVDIKTKDASGVILESMTSGPFFLGQAGSLTLTVNVFNDNGAGGGIADNNTKDGSESGIQSATVFLFSPGIGGQNKATDVNGVASFTSLASGDYMFGLDPGSVASGDFVANTSNQPVTISTNTTKNYGLRASTVFIQGTITGPASTSIDVFASPTTGAGGFVRRNYNTGGGGSVAYSLPVSASTTYSVGVTQAIPTTFMQPGAPPPPPPTFTFMPPSNLTVNVGASSSTGKNFTLTSASSSITGIVQDSSGTGVSGAMAFARPVQSSTGGTQSGFGTGAQADSSGNFTLKVTPGVYLVGVFKPGMPNLQEQQITVPTSGANTPATLTFKFSSGTSLSISGKVTDDSSNTIPYAGVGGRKVVSTSNTNPVGGGSDTFVGGPTDANGAYTLYVSAGTWVVEAYAPGFGKLGTKTITVTTSNVTGQDFSASTLNAGTIKGQATKSISSVAVAQQGVMVRAQGSNGGNMAITDALGNYALKMPAGSYTVTCFFPGVGESTPLTNVAVTASTDTTGKDCTLAAPITITVTLTDGTNAITNAFVDVRDTNGRGNGTGTSTTAGVYTVVVPPGTYTVRAGSPSYGPIGSTSSVSTTQSITYTATAGVTYAVTGTVTGDSIALGSAWVSLIGSPTGQTQVINLGTQTASDGTYSISAPNGTYKLRADSQGYKTSGTVTVTVSGAAKTASTINVTTATRTISGTVKLDGSSVANAFVDAGDGAGGFVVSQTDSTGAYSLAVDNGTWSVRAHSKGYEGGPNSIVVSNNSPSSQNITLSAISGFTLSADTSETITPSSGGYLTNSNIGSAFKINIPANALGTGSNASTVTTNVNTALPNPPSGSILKINSVTISAVDSSGQPIKTLNSPVTITIPYDITQLPTGTSAANLVIGTWNSATRNYDAIATTVDTTAHTLTMTISHFSDFAPLVSTDPSPLSTPTGLTATNTGTGTSVSLSWSSVSGAATYNVYKSSDNSSFPLLASPTTNSYTATGLTNGQTYYFKVSAVKDAGGESAASSAASVSVSTNSGASGGGSSSGSSATSAPATSTAPAASAAPAAAPTAAPAPTPVAVSSGPVTIPSLSAKPSNDELAAVITAVTKQIVYIQANLKAPNILSILQDTISKLVQVQNALGASTAPAVPPVASSAPLKKPLSVGSKGSDVSALQNFLKAQGSDVYPDGTVSGNFGPLTEKALGRFQLKYGLVKSAKDVGYGYLGPKTRAKINELLTK